MSTVIHDLTEDKTLDRKAMAAVQGGIRGQRRGRFVGRFSMSPSINGGDFQGWTEKGNQVDQQLAFVLRTMRDMRRIGIGGSDLGSS